MCISFLVFLTNEGSEFMFFEADGQECRHEVIACWLDDNGFGPVCGEQYVKGVPVGFLGSG